MTRAALLAGAAQLLLGGSSFFDDFAELQQARGLKLASRAARQVVPPESGGWQANTMIVKVVGVLNDLGKQAMQERMERTMFFHEADEQLKNDLTKQQEVLDNAKNTLLTAAVEKGDAETKLSELEEEGELLGTDLKEDQGALEKLEAGRKEEHELYRKNLQKNEDFRDAVRLALEQFDGLAGKMGGEEAMAALQLQGQVTHRLHAAANFTAHNLEDLKQMISELEQEAMTELETMNENEKTHVETFEGEKTLLSEAISKAEARLEKIQKEDVPETSAIIQEKKDALETATEYEQSSSLLIAKLAVQKEKGEKEFETMEKDLMAQENAVANAVQVLQGGGVTGLALVQGGGAGRGHNSAATSLSFVQVVEKMQTTLLKSRSGKKGGEHRSLLDSDAAEVQRALKWMKSVALQNGMNASENQKQQQDPSYVSTSMKKVTTMIKTLITKLKQENVEDLKAQEMCDGMLKSDAETLHSAKGILSWYKNTDTQLHAEVADLWTDLEDVKTEVAKLEDAIAGRNKTHVEEMQLNAATIADAQEAIPVVETALLELGTAATNTKALDGAIAMLEVVQEDMRKTIEETEEATFEAMKDYGEIHSEEGSNLAALKKEVILKNETMWQKNTLYHINTEHHEPWAAAKVDNAGKKLADSERMCNIAESYEERKMRRDSLLESLKSALALAQSSAAATPALLVMSAGRASGARTIKRSALQKKTKDFGDDELAAEFEEERKSQIALAKKRFGDSEQLSADGRKKSSRQRTPSSRDAASRPSALSRFIRGATTSAFSTRSSSLAQLLAAAEIRTRHTQAPDVAGSAPPAGAAPKNSSPTTTPVSKVISLLEHVREEVTGDVTKDQEFIEKMRHYCETEITKNKFEIENSDKEVLFEQKASLTGTIAALEMDLTQIAEDLDSQQSSLKQMAEVFESELEEKQDTERELTEAITGLSGALVILGKHLPSSFVAKTSTSGTNFLEVKDGETTKIDDVLASSSNLSQIFAGLKALLFGSSSAGGGGLVQKIASITNQKEQPTSSDVFLQAERIFSTAGADAERDTQLRQIPAPPTSRTQYRSAGTDKVFGILESMHETFEKELSELRVDITRGKTEYAALRTKKSDEIAALDDQQQQKRAENNNAQLELQQVARQLGKSGAVFEAAKKTLHELEITCAAQEDAYGERVTARDQELAALDATLVRLGAPAAGAGSAAEGADGTSEQTVAFGLFAGARKKLQEAAGKGHQRRGAIVRRKAKSAGSGTAPKSVGTKAVDGESKNHLNDAATSTSAGASGAAPRRTAAQPKKSSRTAIVPGKTAASGKNTVNLKALKFSDDDDDATSSVKKLLTASSHRSPAQLPRTTRMAPRKLAFPTKNKGPTSALLSQTPVGASAAERQSQLAEAARVIVARVEERVQQMKESMAEEVQRKDECEKDTQEAALALTEKQHLFDKHDGELELQEGLAATYHPKIVGKGEEAESISTELALLEQSKMEEVEAIKEKIKDDQESGKLLQSAIDELQRFYGASVAGVFFQEGEEQSTSSRVVFSASDSASGILKKNETEAAEMKPAPANPYEKHQAGGSIVVLLQTMLAEVEATVGDDLQRLNELKASYRKEKTDFEEQRHAVEKAKVSLVAESNSVNATVEELVVLRTEAMEAEEVALKMKQSVGERCGVLLANFEHNQELRQHEIDFMHQVVYSLQGQRR